MSLLSSAFTFAEIFFFGVFLFFLAGGGLGPPLLSFLYERSLKLEALLQTQRRYRTSLFPSF